MAESVCFGVSIYRTHAILSFRGRVAQLVRASALHAEGPGFEPLHAHQNHSPLFADLDHFATHSRLQFPHRTFLGYVILQGVVHAHIWPAVACHAAYLERS
jgi:hypothetical protein